MRNPASDLLSDVTMTAGNQYKYTLEAVDATFVDGARAGWSPEVN